MNAITSNFAGQKNNNQNYKYYMPTMVIFGKNCVKENSQLFTTLGKKALIVTGTQSAKRNGSEKDVRTALETAGISYLVYDKVIANPTIACVYEGAKIAKANEVDFIIAIGGGSPMDAGKAIALLAAQDITEENLFSGPYAERVLPLAMIPTTAGTGSEVTQYSVLTNEKSQTKTSISSDLLFPRIAFLDAKYTVNLPAVITINTALDALSHAIESMLSIRASYLSNILAADSIRILMDCIPDVLEAQKSEEGFHLAFETREQLLLASTLAGIVIAQTGTTIVHSMGYSLTYFKNIDHGRANALLLGEYLRLVNEVQPNLTARILNAMNLSGLEAFATLIDSLLGNREKLSPAEITQFSKIAVKAKNITNCIVQPNEEDIRRIYANSLLK
ncbi:MAG TPA: iron-containing alcohol dehydrogenase [Peptococcaceae bacterium]|nr:iron-containing alcohol dehydrogenase [Peptococcaceae bacterium]